MHENIGRDAFDRERRQVIRAVRARAEKSEGNAETTGDRHRSAPPGAMDQGAADFERAASVPFQLALKCASFESVASSASGVASASALTMRSVGFSLSEMPLSTSITGLPPAFNPICDT